MNLFPRERDGMQVAVYYINQRGAFGTEDYAYAHICRNKSLSVRDSDTVGHAIAHTLTHGTHSMFQWRSHAEVTDWYYSGSPKRVLHMRLPANVLPEFPDGKRSTTSRFGSISERSRSTSNISPPLEPCHYYL